MDSAVHVLVLSNPEAKHLQTLEPLKPAARFTTGTDPEMLRETAPLADVILNGMFTGDLLRLTFPLAARVRWVHTLSAGVEHVLFPEMVHSPEAGLWQQFYVEELHGRTMGIVGYGEIGRSAATLAQPFGMRVVALRRRTSLSIADPLLDAVYPPEGLHQLLRESDYVVVIINVGRGPVIVESALIRALQDRRIRGAALDVFDQEPLPAAHPFWHMHNVLISPHSADHTAGWLELAMNMFVRNFHHLMNNEPFENLVDKHAGY